MIFLCVEYLQPACCQIDMDDFLMCLCFSYLQCSRCCVHAGLKEIWVVQSGVPAALKQTASNRAKSSMSELREATTTNSQNVTKQHNNEKLQCCGDALV